MENIRSIDLNEDGNMDIVDNINMTIYNNLVVNNNVNENTGIDKDENEDENGGKDKNIKDENKDDIKSGLDMDDDWVLVEEKMENLEESKISNKPVGNDVYNTLFKYAYKCAGLIYPDDEETRGMLAVLMIVSLPTVAGVTILAGGIGLVFHYLMPSNWRLAISVSTTFYITANRMLGNNNSDDNIFDNNVNNRHRIDENNEGVEKNKNSTDINDINDNDFDLDADSDIDEIVDIDNSSDINNLY